MDKAISCADRLSDLCEELRLLHVTLRGAISILDNEGLGTYAAVRRAGNTNDKMAFEAIAAVIYLIDSSICSLVDLYTQ